MTKEKLDPKKLCNHQYYDSEDFTHRKYEITFNFCPWCGKDLNKVPITLPSQDDCQKGGCAD